TLQLRRGDANDNWPSLPLGFKATAPPAPRVRGQSAWREIALEIRPDSLQAWDRGHFLGTVTRKELAHLIARSLATQGRAAADAPSSFVEGGLGLFVFGSTADFRSLVISPLAGQP